MSYILDALKKSDRERQRDTSALPLHEVPAFRARPRRSRRARVVAGVVLLVAGAAAGGAWMARSTGEAQQRAVNAINPPVAISLPAAGETAAGSVALASVPAAVPDPVTAPDPTPAQDRESGNTGGASTPAAASREGLLELWQLTEAEQKYLGGLDVSFHVHSNDASKRAVIINGLRAKEGQSLGEDLRLNEIVPDGIVLEFQGQLVHLANPQPY